MHHLACVWRTFAAFLMISSLGYAFQSYRRQNTHIVCIRSDIRLLASKTGGPSKATKRQGDFWEARMNGWRPTINDVERISWGKPAKRKGTGSRGVPHRLNEEERSLFDQARRKGFLEVAGSGWRSQRRDAPLLNSYRSLCDARGQASVVLHKGNTGIDSLVVDLSTLRTPESFEAVASFCLANRRDGDVLREDRESFSGPLSSDDEDEDFSDDDDDDDDDQWGTRPIYQLPTFCVVWELPRAEAKALGKELAEMFDTAEAGRSSSKKPTGVKPGRNRRHGGYGIG